MTNYTKTLNLLHMTQRAWCNTFLYMVGELGDDLDAEDLKILELNKNIARGNGR